MEDRVKKPTSRARHPLTKATKQAVWEKTQGRCWYCGQHVVSAKQAGDQLGITQHIEHQTPFCEGGTDEVVNLVLACKGCNYDKGMKNLEEFRQTIYDRTAELLEYRGECVTGRWHLYCYGQIEEELTLAVGRVANALRKMRIVFYGEIVWCEQVSDYCI